MTMGGSSSAYTAIYGLAESESGSGHNSLYRYIGQDKVLVNPTQCMTAVSRAVSGAFFVPQTEIQLFAPKCRKLKQLEKLLLFIQFWANVQGR